MFNKIVLDIITKKFDIQVDENTKTQATLLHDDIPGYDLPTIDFVQTSKDNHEDISILEEDNPQIYAHLNNVLIHMIDKQEAAIFKSKQDFNQNKEKILEYIKCHICCFESKDVPTQMTKQSFTIIYFITFKKTIHFKLICKNVHS